MINDYYTLCGQQCPGPSEFLYTVRLNPSCAVYKGHFPGQPVAPGAGQVQIIKECAERALDRRIRLMQIKQCKFLRTIIPTETDTLEVYILLGENGTLTAEVRSGETVYVKFKSQIAIIE